MGFDKYVLAFVEISPNRSFVVFFFASSILIFVITFVDLHFRNLHLYILGAQNVVNQIIWVS